MKTRMTAMMGALVLAAVLVQPASADTLGQHPAVLVAQKWPTRGIDPNTFLVLHPSGARLLAASPTVQVDATREPARPVAHLSEISK
jgi:hypothetical protein